MKGYRGYINRKGETPPTLRENYFNGIIKTIEDELFVSRSRDGSKGFSRKRKIHFIHLIALLSQGLPRSLQRETNSFFQKIQDADFSIQHVTKSAFTQSRAKLKPEAFKELNTVGLDIFYRDASYLQWAGYRLLAIDGSTAVLPRHKSVEEEFGVARFGPYADSPRSIARISMLYDVLNFTTLDVQVAGYSTSERALAREHLAFVQPGKDLILEDRGYTGLRHMFEMQQRGIDYCIRMRDKWWIEARKMLAAGEKDKIVRFKLQKKDRDLLSQYNTSNDTITCRLVAITVPGGEEPLVVCTSVTDRQKLPYECFADLYHKRWNIEEGFKLYKCRVQLESFSGKTAKAVKQDLFAKAFMMSAMAVMAFPIEERIKRDQENSKRKYRHKVNRTNALAMVREIWAKVLVNKTISSALAALDAVLKATTELVRPNRKYPRKKLQKKPPSMNYKQL